MKKIYYFLLFLYSCAILWAIINSLFAIFDFQWPHLLSDIEKLEKFIFFFVILSFSLTVLIVILMKIAQVLILSSIRENLKRLQGNEPLPEKTSSSDIDRSFHLISRKMKTLTENLQKTNNQMLKKEEDIIEKERRRIARDLHDTVSQELFAGNMILSGISINLEKLENEQLATQLSSVATILETAQQDLRILLFHLRPAELEGRSLVEGLSVILCELNEKSDIIVNYQYSVEHLPKKIEEHTFRIAQEIISNTLRHAKASHLSVYLFQNQNEVQLKISDDGVGFDHNYVKKELSYGLKNIDERVNDMAGSLKILTAPKQGVSIDIRVPLLEGETANEGSTN